MKKLSITSLKLFQKAIYKDYGIKLSDTEAKRDAQDLLEYVNSMIKFDLENKSKVLKSST